MNLSLSIMLVLFGGLAILGVPLSFATGISALAFFLISGSSLNTVIHTFFTSINSFVLMAIPMFIFAGQIMSECKISDGIIKFSDLIVGRFRGGLAQVNILASMFFGGCSGSALADVTGLGSVLIPAMEEKGYSREFSAAVTVASSIQGPIIPPSIPMVIFASVAQVSTGALLIGGAVPGVLLGLSQMLIVYFISRKRGYKSTDKVYTMREKLAIFKESVPALIMPLLLMGGIFFGIFTPTEAAAVAVAYSILIGFFVYRNLSLKKLIEIGKRVARDSASIFFLIGTAGIFGWILAMAEIPAMLSAVILRHGTSPYLLLFLINILLLIWGMLMDAAPAILIFGPILTPMVEAMGINTIHFGVLMVFNLMIGLMTPPYGLCLFSATTICKSSIGEITKELIPFIFISVIVLFVITYIPEIVLFLPRLSGLLG
ncbi:TRAP transporter, DctM subunit [Treponema maltophilum ATCC 51939]|uniref:TRAP transporter, DctM subunit n=1 Tax=Treponema maltophilum ATCC 51939 TaxID=1125699 RepID=S3L661_TREMA|nr:TRAP transporter large permease [Treponema maltophilum]EPF32299.1 TRAP transporter, DctM subunit [Treponema maltophilum ATCC 51939]